MVSMDVVAVEEEEVLDLHQINMVVLVVLVLLLLDTKWLLDK